MSALAVFVVAALGTYLLRASMVLGGVGARLAPAWTARLGLVAPAMLSAIVASALVVDAGAVRTPTVVEVVAVGVAAWAVRRTGTLAASFAAGFPVYWLLSALT